MEHKAVKAFKDILVRKGRKDLELRVLVVLVVLLELVVELVLKAVVDHKVFRVDKDQIQQVHLVDKVPKAQAGQLVDLDAKVRRVLKVLLVLKGEVEVHLLLVIVFCHIIIGMLVKLVVLHSLVKMATVIQEYLIQILGVILTLLFGTYRIKTRQVMLTADGLVVLCPSIRHTNIDLLHG